MCFSQIRTQTQASQDPLQEILRFLEPPNLDSELMHLKHNDFFMYFPHLLQTASKASWVQRVRVYNLTSRYPPDLTLLGLFCFVLFFWVGQLSLRVSKGFDIRLIRSLISGCSVYIFSAQIVLVYGLKGGP